MVTHNHERFIEQAIASVLMQQTSFSIELLVGDDCSQDGTRRVVSQLCTRYPGVIRPFLHPAKVGPRQNFLGLLEQARGDYVALLEGDDFWTDPAKLQMSAEVLDREPAVAAVFHRVSFLEDGSDRREPRGAPSPGRSTYGLEDVLKRKLAPTCSLMMRRAVIPPFPPWLRSIETMPMADWPLLVFAAQRGTLRLIDREMACYRVHAGGRWSSMDAVGRASAFVTFYDRIDKHLEFAHHDLIRRERARRKLVLASARLCSQGQREALRAWAGAVRDDAALLLQPRSLKVLLRILIHLGWGK